MAEVLGLPRQRLKLPGFVWALMRRLVWMPGVVAIPIYRLHNLFWRLSLILIDGMVGNGQKLNSQIPMTFSGLNESLMATFSNAQIFTCKQRHTND